MDFVRFSFRCGPISFTPSSFIYCSKYKNFNLYVQLSFFNLTIRYQLIFKYRHSNLLFNNKRLRIHVFCFYISFIFSIWFSSFHNFYSSLYSQICCHFDPYCHPTYKLTSNKNLYIINHVGIFCKWNDHNGQNHRNFKNIRIKMKTYERNWKYD